MTRSFLGFAIFVLAVLTVSICAGSARAQSCSDATLNGACVLQLVSAPTTAGVAAGVGPVTVLGRMTFDGAGHFALRLHKNDNGTFVAADTGGTYTVQSNCDGSYSYVNATTGDTDTSDFVLSPSLHVLRVILKSTSGHNPTLRVSTGICKFDE